MIRNFFTAVKLPVSKTGSSLPSTAKVKNGWIFAPAPPICLHGVEKKQTAFVTLRKSQFLMNYLELRSLKFIYTYIYTYIYAYNFYCLEIRTHPHLNHYIKIYERNCGSKARPVITLLLQKNVAAASDMHPTEYCRN